VPYYLDEASGWGLDVAQELKGQLAKARAAGCSVRGLVVINPGNPTGQTLTEDNMKEVVQLCADEGLLLLADEVYQENIWRPDRAFLSFRKVAAAMGFADAPDSGLALVSFHSISKGFVGECGLRGGYFELFGVLPEVLSEGLGPPPAKGTVRFTNNSRCSFSCDCSVRCLLSFPPPLTLSLSPPPAPNIPPSLGEGPALQACVH
jgi:hypothetical protein